MTISEIREAVAVLPRFKNGKLSRVPDELRAAILEQVKRCEGPRTVFAESIGVSASVVDSWLKSKQPRVGKLRPVRIVENVVQSSRGSWRLDGPQGLRVSGMTIGELAELFHKLEAR